MDVTVVEGIGDVLLMLKWKCGVVGSSFVEEAISRMARERGRRLTSS